MFAEGERNDMQSTITRRTEWLNAAMTPMKETNSLHMGKYVMGISLEFGREPIKTLMFKQVYNWDTLLYLCMLIAKVLMSLCRARTFPLIEMTVGKGR